MAITNQNCVDRFVSKLAPNGFPNIAGAEYPILRKLEMESYQHDATLGEGIPHTLASFVWYNPRPSFTPPGITHTQCTLRPIAKCRLIEMTVEVRTAGNNNFTINLYKNNVLIGTVTLASSVKYGKVEIAEAYRDISRDDFLAYKIVESCSVRPLDLTIYVRHYQYPYMLEDAQVSPPMPT